MPVGGRITEAEVATALLRVLAKQPNGEASPEVLKQEVPNYLSLSPEDQQQSQTRINEELWEQQIRNIVNHRTTEGNVINDGLIEYHSGTMRITDAGRSHLSSEGLG